MGSNQGVLRILRLCSGSARACSGLLGLARACSGSAPACSPSAQVCSPSAQVKAAVARPETKTEPAKGKINAESMGISSYNILVL